MGNSYIAGQTAFYHGDADVLIRRVRPETVRLLLTDPPYNVTRENNLDTMGRRGIEFEWDGEFDQEAWLPAAAKTIMPWGSIIIWNDWKNLGQIAHALVELGFDVKREIVWSKANPMPRNTDRSYVQAREYALWAVKIGKQREGKWVFNKRPDKPYERGEFAYPVQHSKHQAKKPDGLFAELIAIHTNPGDLVLDPYAGEATTAVAAATSGRRSISFEKLKHNYEDGTSRLQAVLAQQKLPTDSAASPPEMEDEIENG